MDPHAGVAPEGSVHGYQNGIADMQALHAIGCVAMAQRLPDQGLDQCSCLWIYFAHNLT